jgi:hypothetical protein
MRMPPPMAPHATVAQRCERNFAVVGADKRA